MRRKRLAATALVSLVIGAVLALLAPTALAASSDESGSSPGNRGWVVKGDSDSDWSDSDDD
ncbi:hypothetical protein FHX44_117329 [Pseudonocardia hierapolitana]|uniref:Uncharacterized protein n=1 Tax=Pseudonocardia hierapolitana TaxID=1128676 RepID=A0A561T2P0_9PSEU|nr:hypothetical protein [Pseudonocardia hierapolitana]TWF81386.1 hypothetical protein FHX44_117329 [Pseudonocardia hierapolitana]